MSLTTKTEADRILAIPVDRPDKLFNKNVFIIECRRLLQSWHPDFCRESYASAVFAHITKIKNSAQKRIKDDTWPGDSTIKFTTKYDKTFKFKYKRTKPFELGEYFIGDNYLMYVVKPEFEKFFDNAVTQINNIKYASPELKKEFEKYMPEITSYHKNTTIGHVLCVRKTPDQVMLQDLLDYLPDHKLEPRHVAWMVNSLLNIMCFFHVNNLCLGGISSDTIFISPEFHSTTIYGGWWYATKVGEKIIGLPKTSIDILPSKLLVDKLAKIDYNQYLVKASGLLGLGDSTKTGTKLLMNKDIPKEMISWLQLPPKDNAIQDYVDWGNILHEIYGKRTFVELNVDVLNIY